MKNQSGSRRKFMKNMVAGSAAIYGLPVTGAVAAAGLDKTLTREPVLPMTIYAPGGLPTETLEKISKISGDIKVVSGSDEASKDKALETADVYLGRIPVEDYKKSKKLKWIQSTSAGVENQLFPEVANSDVLITNGKGCYGPAISEHVFGMIFGLTRGIAQEIQHMAENKWENPGGQVEMLGLTICIVGFGGIGRQTARRAKAMDMKVIGVDIVPFYETQIGGLADEMYLVDGGGLEEALSKADIVVSAAPHTPRSEYMFNEKRFKSMKDEAYFINVSRGKLTKTPDLMAALKSGKIAGAGLDVTDPEPLPSDHELWGFDNVIITSHNSGKSQYSQKRVQEVFVENVARYAKGLPMINQVDKEAGF